MDWGSALSFVIVSFAWGASLLALRGKGRFSSSPQKIARRFLIIAGIGVFVVCAYLSRAQFVVWQGNPITARLLPPHQPIGYFLQYIWSHLWAPYALSFMAGLIAYALARFMNAWTSGRLFEDEEPYLIAMGIFLTRHPGWIAYLALVAALYFAFIVFQSVRLRSLPRVSFTYFWLPSAMLMLAFEGVFASYGWYGMLSL